MEYGEGNVIVTLLTGELGKVGLMVRGAKKPRSRHAAVAQPFTYGEYVFFRSNAGSLGTLNHADLLNAFPGIRGEPRLSAYAAYLAELVDRLVPDGEASAFVFEQLKGAYEALSGGKEPAVVGAIMELKLLQFGGVAPITDVCAECGRTPEPQESVSWSPGAGGLLCVRCRGRHTDADRLPPAARKLLPSLQRADLRRLGDIRVKASNAAAVRAALSGWIDTHVDVRLRTRSVLEKIEAVYAPAEDAPMSEPDSN